MALESSSILRWTGRSRGLAASGLLGALLTIEASLAASAVPGPQFQVNTFTGNGQFSPAAAMNAAGHSMIAWQSQNQDGNEGGIFAQRYDAGGAPQGGEFQVNTFTSGDQRDPAVGVDGAGNSVVVWGTLRIPSGFCPCTHTISARRFDANGTSQGPEFLVVTGASHTHGPALGMGAAGNFVVAWTVDDGGVFAQRFDANGTPQGAAFGVDMPTARSFEPAVATNAAGNFVVTWAGADQFFSNKRIYAQSFGASGTALTPGFQINTSSTTGDWDRPALAMDAAGNFAIAWRGNDFQGNLDEVRARAYMADGTPRGAEFQVSDPLSSSANRPKVAIDSAGGFVIAWESMNHDEDVRVFARSFDAAGISLGSEFQVNDPRARDRSSSPAMAMDAAGNSLVAWSGPSDGGDNGIFARRFTVGPALPSLSINDLSAAEADAGTTGALFTVTLSAAASQAVTVDFAPAQGTALAGEDFSASSGTLTFNPGETTKFIGVIINGDTRDEPDETFLVNLSNPAGATIARGQGVATIIDDDPAPALSIDDVSVTEGDSGRTLATFIARLSAASGREVTVDFSTTPDTAWANNDFATTSGTRTFNRGETTKAIEVEVFGDTENEVHETFFVNLSGATNATISDGQGTATIVNDDPLPPQLRLFKEFVVSGSITNAHTVNNGATVNYRLTVSNNGNGPTTQTIRITDTLAAGLTFLAASDPRCSAVGQEVTCVWSGPLAESAREEFDLMVQVGPNVAPPGGFVEIHNSATVSTPDDSDPLDNSSIVVVLTVEAPDVTPPVVTPPADLTVDPILAIGTYGAEPHPESRKVADFLAGARATDDADLFPSALAIQVVDCSDISLVLERSASTGTLFPVGQSCVRFPFIDAAGNIGAAVARLTVNPPAGGVIPGPDVPVTATDASNTPQEVEVTFFGDVTPQALLVAQPILPPPAAPAGFAFRGTVYDITTTATFTPPVEVCFLGSGFTAADLIWHDGAVIPLAQHTVHTPTRVCIMASSLSPFGVATRLPPPGLRFRRGDFNGDGRFDISDALAVLAYLFLGKPRDPQCLASANANGDGVVNLADVVYLLKFLYLGGQEPPAPFPGCGEPPATESLACRSFPGCAP